MRITLRVEGGEQLARALNQLPERVNNRMLKAALLQAAEPIRDTAQNIAPREPGAPDLADNIAIRVARREEPHDVAVVVGPTKHFYYGFFQEFGTARHSAQPFMRPAFEMNKEKVIATMTRNLWQALAQLGGTRGLGSGVGL